ncbi:MAG: hypothetical protein ISQ21_07485 [Alphaproteobacteria bacterium]|nr:hypothetical protein [Alphaproteobacteria bacterium]
MILRENGISSTWIIAAIMLDQGYFLTTGSATLDTLLEILIYVLDVILGFIYNLCAVPADIIVAIMGDDVGQILFRIGLEAGSFQIAMIYLIILVISFFLPDGNRQSRYDDE